MRRSLILATLAAFFVLAPVEAGLAAKSPLLLSDHHIAASTTVNSQILVLVDVTNTSTSAIQIGWVLNQDAPLAWLLTGSANTTCGSPGDALPAGNTCSIELSLFSADPGRFGARLTVNDLTGSTSKSVGLRGTVT